MACCQKKTKTVVQKMHRGPMFDNEKLYIICYNVKSEKKVSYHLL